MNRLSFLAILACVQIIQGLEVLDCIAAGSPGCLEGHLNSALSRAEHLPVLRITRHLAIVANPQSENEVETQGATTLEKLERYLYAHSLKLDLPQELISGAKGLISEELLSQLPNNIVLPLAETDSNSETRQTKEHLINNLQEKLEKVMKIISVVEYVLRDFDKILSGRGFIKKIVMPFLLGLKFKATAVIPLAMALIALKTWKALTLGLLSLVLSAAMVIFRLTRPKVLNYEVYYPPHHHHHIDEHYHGRSSDSSLAYRAYAK